MTVERYTVDVVVVGAGTAGSAAATMMAESGLDVVMLESRELTRAGPQWVATIVPWAFERARLPLPQPPELRSAGDRSSILDASGRIQFTVDPSPAMSVNLRLLAARLHDMAKRAGVRCLDRVRLGELRLERGRPVSLETVRKDSKGRQRRMTFASRLFVDATGLDRALKRQIPLLARDCPRVPAEHLCSAAQQVCRITDLEGARRYVRDHDGQPGEVLAGTGVNGGFSTMWVHVDHDIDTVDLLTGAIADGKHATGPQMLRDFKGRHAWIGERLSGGSSLIPLRRPYDRLSAPGIALIGNAACQVFPAHGSGVGLGLMAARILTDAVTQADDPGSAEATWVYQAAFHQEHGPVLGVYDLFRRFSQTLSEDDVAKLLKSSAVSRVFYEAVMVQKLPQPRLRDLVVTLKSSLRTPALSAGIAALLPRMVAAHELYRRHPLQPDGAKLKLWSKAVARVFRETADVGASY